MTPADPRLPQLYEDVELLAGKLREVAEAHVLLTPPDDALSFILIVSSPGSSTGFHTFQLADGSPDLGSAVLAIAQMAQHWVETGGGVVFDRPAADLMREIFGSW